MWLVRVICFVLFLGLMLGLGRAWKDYQVYGTVFPTTTMEEKNND